MAFRLLEDGLAGAGDRLAADADGARGCCRWRSATWSRIAQTNLKRMLAYSTISHIGFLLLGLLNGTAGGYAAGDVLRDHLRDHDGRGLRHDHRCCRARASRPRSIDDFKGLNQRNGWYAMHDADGDGVAGRRAGLVGFIAKFQVLKAAVESAACCGWRSSPCVFAVIGAFYYLRVIKVMYFDDPATTEPLALPNDMPFRFVLSAERARPAGPGDPRAVR